MMLNIIKMSAFRGKQCTRKYFVYIFLIFLFYNKTDKQRMILMLPNGQLHMNVYIS